LGDKIKADEQVWVGKPEGRVKLGRPVYRWENNIKMALKDVMFYVI
jgi:hypothetical protein